MGFSWSTIIFLSNVASMQELTGAYTIYIDGLVQERCNSIANALEFCLSCTNPSTCHLKLHMVYFAMFNAIFFKASHRLVSRSVSKYWRKCSWHQSITCFTDHRYWINFAIKLTLLSRINSILFRMMHRGRDTLYLQKYRRSDGINIKSGKKGI